MVDVNQLDTNKWSKSELIYLMIFDILEDEHLDALHIYNRVKSILKPVDQIPHSTYVYQVIKKMKENRWIDSYDSSRRNANLFLTQEGKLQWVQMKQKNIASYEKIYKKLEYFIRVLDNKKPIPVILSKDEMKMFNRVINVKLAIHYLFLQHLVKHDSSSGLSFIHAIKDKHSWEFNDGYFYQVTRMMESDEYRYITGRWDDDRRRNSFLYQLTATGRGALETEYNSFRDELISKREYLEILLKYMTN